MFIRKEYGDRQKEDKSKLEREYTQLFLYNKRSPVQEQRFQTLKKLLNK
jgi:hypothetical protein